MPQNPKSPANPIEHPKLIKIGGVLKLIRNSLVELVIIVLIGSVAGYLAGHMAQKSFSDLTGYPKKEVVAAEDRQEGIKEEPAGLIETSLQALNDTEIVQKAKESAKSVVSNAVKPVTDKVDALLRVLFLAAFWVPFCLLFILTAWLTNKLLFAKHYFLTDGVNPQVIRNMEILEAKVNELVDRANQNSIT